jgi:hypothetical protein
MMLHILRNEAARSAGRLSLRHMYRCRTMMPLHQPRFACHRKRFMNRRIERWNAARNADRKRLDETGRAMQSWSPC